MKRLRPFVTFNYDLRNNLETSLNTSQKAEITRYYNMIAAAVSDKHVIYRPKNPTNRKRAAKALGQRAPKLKAFAVNSPTGQGRVKLRGDTIAIEKEGGFVRTIYPDQTRLAREPRKYLREILDPKKRYIINSKNDWRAGGDVSKVIDALERAMFKYGWGEEPDDELDEDGEPRKERFTITIVEVDLKGQRAFEEYKAARYDEKEKRAQVERRDREAKRKRQSRARNKRGKR